MVFRGEQQILTKSFSRFLFVGLLVLTACSTLQSTARSQFVHSASCPADRVTVAHPAPEPAPTEIAADPDRLAVWNADAERRASRIYVARGCGTERRCVCDTMREGTASYPECTPISDAP